MFSTLKQKFRTFLFRPKIEGGTVTLTQRRIFILPTRQGLLFALVLLVMLLGDINYNLSLGYILTFLLTTTAMLTMLYAFRTLAQLHVHAGRVDAVFAGDAAEFSFHFHNASSLPRYALVLRDMHGHSVQFDLPAQQSTTITLPLPTTQRGWFSAGRLTLYTEFPLGLFHAWSYLHFDTLALVYPTPAAPHPLPENSAHNGIGTLTTRGDEDFSGLRSYVAGDPLPRIAWKALAREQGLQVKQFSGAQGSELWLDWALLPPVSVEKKLELLTRWVLDAEAAGLHYGLRLPDGEVPPSQSNTQRADCLRRLALYGLQEAKE